MNQEELLSKLKAHAVAASNPLARFALRIWRNDRIFLLLVCAMNVFFSRRTWGAGIWADNDSVCHYAYLRHLVDEFYPATGTFMGFSPKYNLGLPYLIFNTPPGLYVASALVAKVTGLSALASLKVVVVSAFLSVPLLGYALAKTFEEEKTDLPKFAALTLSLFSSELFGLEFYFKNGMLNPALAVPLMMGTLIAYRHAQLARGPKALRWVALGAVLFALTVFTHVLSAYMACVALMAFMLGHGLRELGASVLKLGAMVTIGALLTAEWLYPSLAFAAKTDAAYTWSRHWASTLGDFADGSLFSSYPVGFFPSFITTSNVGIVLTFSAAFAVLYVAFKRFNGGVVSCAIGTLLATLIAFGPTIHFGVSILPLYDKLLWYRFVTLVTLTWMMVASFGLYKIAAYRGRFYPLNLLVLAVVGVWSFFVMTTRAVKIATAESYVQFEASTSDIATWLRDHGDKRGRVFSEFLGQGAVRPISVNYPRHMIPVLSGFEEAGGWIYENNPASQGLMKKGPFWFNPMPMIDEAEHYDVKYVVAGSPQLTHALLIDARWKEVVQTPDLHLFERVDFTPSLVESNDASLAASVAERAFVRGGGYAYELDVDAAQPLAAPAAVLVKTNFGPAWRATMDGVSLPIRSTDDGLIIVDVPAATSGKHRIALRWSIDDLRAKGRRGTLVGIVLAALALALGQRKRWWSGDERAARAVQVGGTIALVLALLGFAWRSRKIDLSDIGGFGVANGMLATQSPARLEVGAFDDDIASRPLHVLARAWSSRHALGGEHARTLSAGEDAAVVTFGRAATLTFYGRTPEPIELELRAEAAEPSCKLRGVVGTPIEVGAACVLPKDERLLGRRAIVRLTSPAQLDVTTIEVKSDIRYVEAESLHNTVYDGGFEAFYAMTSSTEYFPLNGVIMTASPPYGRPIDLLGEIALPAGQYDVWLLANAFHERLRMTRANASMIIDDASIGTFDGVSQSTLDFWDRDGRWEWSRVGRATMHDGKAKIDLRFERKHDAAAAGVDVDAIAFEPR